MVPADGFYVFIWVIISPPGLTSRDAAVRVPSPATGYCHRADGLPPGSGDDPTAIAAPYLGDHPRGRRVRETDF